MTSLFNRDRGIRRDRNERQHLVRSSVPDPQIASRHPACVRRTDRRDRCIRIEWRWEVQLLGEPLNGCANGQRACRLALLHAVEGSLEPRRGANNPVHFLGSNSSRIISAVSSSDRNSPRSAASDDARTSSRSSGWGMYAAGFFAVFGVVTTISLAHGFRSAASA
jgi:hypothetical protein